jgi:hypothetical protein
VKAATLGWSSEGWPASIGRVAAFRPERATSWAPTLWHPRPSRRREGDAGTETQHEKNLGGVAAASGVRFEPAAGQLGVRCREGESSGIPGAGRGLVCWGRLGRVGAARSSRVEVRVASRGNATSRWTCFSGSFSAEREGLIEPLDFTRPCTFRSSGSCLASTSNLVTSPRGSMSYAPASSQRSSPRCMTISTP